MIHTRKDTEPTTTRIRVYRQKEEAKLSNKKNFMLFATSALLLPYVAAAPAEGAGFSDTIDDSQEEAIHALLQAGIIKDYSDGTFRPDQPLTRADVIMIMGKWLETLDFQIPHDYKSKPRFSDLTFSSHDELLQYAAMLKDYGIIIGSPDGNLNPQERMTRENTAIVLGRAYHAIHNIDFTSYIRNQDFKSTVADHGQAKAEARPFIDILDYFNIIDPSAPYFQPKEVITQGQLASFLAKSAAVTIENEEQLMDKVLFAGNSYFAYADGKATSASFRAPAGMAISQDGSLLIVDSENHLIRKVRNEEVTTFAGMTLEIDDSGLPLGGLYDGDKDRSFFQSPTGIAVDAEGNVFIADTLNHAIRKIGIDGQVSTIAGNGLVGNEDGTGEDARFHSPQSIVIDKNGTLYVADTLNHVIRKITVDGNVTTLNTPSDRIVQITPGVVEWAGDFQDGLLEDAKFNEPSGLAIDSKGNLFVSDSGNQLIRYIDFTENTVSTIAGKYAAPKPGLLYTTGNLMDGPADNAAFNFPKGLSYSETHGLLIADSVNKSVRSFKDGKVRTIANGFKNPVSITTDSNGNVFIADNEDNRIYQLTFERGTEK